VLGFKIKFVHVVECMWFRVLLKIPKEMDAKLFFIFYFGFEETPSPKNIFCGLR
jgi:hypothetical protein